MKTLRISEENWCKIKALLAKLIGKQGNPALIMDDAVTELLETYEKYQKETN